MQIIIIAEIYPNGHTLKSSEKIFILGFVIQRIASFIDSSSLTDLAFRNS